MPPIAMADTESRATTRELSNVYPVGKSLSMPMERNANPNLFTREIWNHSTEDSIPIIRKAEVMDRFHSNLNEVVDMESGCQYVIKTSKQETFLHAYGRSDGLAFSMETTHRTKV